MKFTEAPKETPQATDQDRERAIEYISRKISSPAEKITEKGPNSADTMAPEDQRELAITEIVMDAKIQPRDRVDESAVDRYVTVIHNHCELPPPVVFEVTPGKFLLSDGVHRIRALEKIGRKSAIVCVKKGSFADAVVWAISANREHGIPLTKAEQKKCALRLLQLPEYRARASTVIARLTGLSDKTVEGLRKGESGNSGDVSRSYPAKDGKERRTKTRKSGTQKKKQAKETPVSSPEPSNRPGSPAPDSKPEGSPTPSTSPSVHVSVASNAEADERNNKLVLQRLMELAVAAENFLRCDAFSLNIETIEIARRVQLSLRASNAQIDSVLKIKSSVDVAVSPPLMAA